MAELLPDDYYGEKYRQYRWDLTLRRDYQRAAFEAGWLQPTWPREHGGRSLGLRDAMEIRIEAAVRSAPKLPNIQGPGVAAPGIRQFGTPAQIDRLLVPLLRGDEWWALGMSEPEAGSDFAGLRTRAERDGDVFRVNGHKIWTTQAHESRWCTLYVRTDPRCPETSRHLLPDPRPAVTRGADRTHPDGVDLRRDVLRGLPRRRRGAGRKICWAR